MPNLRVKGQDVEVAVLQAGEQVAALTDVRSFEVTPQIETTQEGYLGETTDRYDDIFKGVSLSMEVHLETQDIFKFWTAVLDRAQRRDPTLTINIKATLNFPNGETPRLVLKDVYFGPMPLNFGGRSEYGSVRIEGKCSNVKPILS